MKSYEVVGYFVLLAAGLGLIATGAEQGDVAVSNEDAKKWEEEEAKALHNIVEQRNKDQKALKEWVEKNKKADLKKQTVPSTGTLFRMEFDGHWWIVNKSGSHFVHSPNCLCGTGKGK